MERTPLAVRKRHPSPVESFRMFQGKVLDEYDQIVQEFGLEVIDAKGSITEQQRVVRTLIAQHVRMKQMETNAKSIGSWLYFIMRAMKTIKSGLAEGSL